MTLLKRKRAGLTDAMSVVTRFVNACNRHDADAVYACLHPDFDSIQPMHPSRNFRGADQVRRNWQAIFDAEPGFRLTVLRSAALDDTVWLELHGAGRDAEVAGVFVMGIQGDRIRWARIYSALVEPVPAAADDGTAAAPPHEVPRVDESPSAGNGEVVEEALIAPVVDIERSGRRRRRSRRAAEDKMPVEEPVSIEEAVPVEDAVADAVSVDEPVPVEDAGAEPEVVAEPAPRPEMHDSDLGTSEVEVVVISGDAAGDAAGDADADPQVDAVVVVTEEVPSAHAEPQVLVEPDPEIVAEPEVQAPQTPAPQAPAPEAQAPEPAASETPERDPEPPADPPRRRFGKKSR